MFDLMLILLTIGAFCALVVDLQRPVYLRYARSGLVIACPLLLLCRGR